MATKISTERARAFCRALKTDTDGRPMRWRAIRSIAELAGLEDPAEAIVAAVEKGWLEVEGGHSVCLTDAGRRI